MSALRPSLPQTPSAGPPLGLVRELVAELAKRQVSYCHWKSNDQLARSLAGQNDLDLLVARPHADRMLQAAGALGFKRAVSRHDRSFPALEDYYGLDAETHCLVHLHVHYQLMLGEPLLKNHRLPIERVMLATARRDGPLPVPDPACELAVLVVRVLLKQRAIQLLRPTSGRHLSEVSGRELMSLLERTRAEDARAFVAEHLAALPPELFDEGLAMLLRGAPLARRLALRRRVLRALAPYSRRGRLWAVGAFVTRRLYPLAVRGLEGRTPRKRPAGGGLAIALLGSDGSGKSTAVAEISRWLGGVFDVRTAHLGKPPRSLVSHFVDRLVGVLRRLAGRRSTSWSFPDDAPDAPAWFQWLNALRFALLGRDRFREYRRVRRLAGQGAIVVCDRFPRPELSLMECASGQALPLASHWALRGLVRAEGSYYRRIDLPDLTLVLRVTPEVAAGRTGDDREFVLRRAREIGGFLQAEPRDVIVIDADQPLERVLAELRSAVWSAL